MRREVSFTSHIPQVMITGHCFIDSQVNQVIFPVVKNNILDKDWDLR